MTEPTVVKKTENFVIEQLDNQHFRLTHSSGMVLEDMVLTTLLDRFAEHCEDQILQAKKHAKVVGDIVAEMKEELGIATKEATIKSMEDLAKSYEPILQSAVLELDVYSRFVSPRSTTVISYPEDKAIEWCISNLPGAVRYTLMKTEFEKEAKARAGTENAIPFVVITKEDGATMARKAISEAVEAAIEDEEAEAGF